LATLPGMDVTPETRKVVATSVYGIIVTTVLLLTLENHESSAWNMVAAILLTVLGFSVAEYYAATLAKGFGETEKEKHYSFDALSHDYLHMLYGSIVPILIFVASALGIITILAAFDIAEAFLGVALFGYGYWYGRSRDETKARSLLYGFINVAAVALIVVLKLTSHL